MRYADLRATGIDLKTILVNRPHPKPTHTILKRWARYAAVNLLTMPSNRLLWTLFQHGGYFGQERGADKYLTVLHFTK